MHASSAAFKVPFAPDRCSILFGTFTLLLLLSASLATAGDWQPAGPAPATGGDVDNIVPDDEVAGAVRVVLPHPSNADILYAATVNGGVWRTQNATAANPAWLELTRGLQSLSIGDLDLDPLDAGHQTLVAGLGNYSSYGTSGPRRGLLRSTDAGATWSEIDGDGRLVGLDISGVAARGNTLVISASFGYPNLFSNVGIFRSVDGGQSWSQISLGDGTDTGLPGGQSDELAKDPNDPARLFTNITFSSSLGGQDGIHRSTDTGATWTKVSNAAMDAEHDASFVTNVRIAVGLTGQVFAAISGADGCVGGLYRSTDGGDSWVTMDTPDVHNSCQGSIHFSIAADPTDSDIVYVGGDLFNRFEVGGFAAGGRLVRCDAAAALGSQCVFLSSVATPDGGGTASGSETHADSRSFAFDAQGNLIEGDDGGVYKRTSPRDNTGDWFSLNGDLQISEGHSTDYDPVANVILVGAQDTGTLAQESEAGTRFLTVDVADGGDVAIDFTSTLDHSVRYSSEQFLNLFRREVYDASNTMISQTFPSLTVPAGDDCATRFTTPVALNAADPTRLVFGCDNHVYESFDQGETLTIIGSGIRATAGGADTMAYGATDDSDRLYVGGFQATGGFDRVFVRAGAAPALTESLTYPGRESGRTVRAIVVDPSAGDNAFVGDDSTIYRTQDGGASWADVTGQLASVDISSPDEFVPLIRALTFVPHDTADSLIAGTSQGAYLAFGPSFNSWQKLGSGLPNAGIYELTYNATDDVIIASAFGRSTWKLAGPNTDPNFFAIFADGFESGDTTAWSSTTNLE